MGEDVQRTLGQLEAKIDILLKQMDLLLRDHEKMSERINSLEQANSSTKAVGAIIASGVGVALSLLGIFWPHK